MSLLSLIVAIVIVGVLLWVINAYIPMQPAVKNILNIVVVIVLILWVLNAFGVIHAISGAKVPRIG